MSKISKLKKSRLFDTHETTVMRSIKRIEKIVILKERSMTSIYIKDQEKRDRFHGVPKKADSGYQGIKNVENVIREVKIFKM